jgi:hypothetical protein
MNQLFDIANDLGADPLVYFQVVNRNEKISKLAIIWKNIITI